jgi:hypothetical protein
VSALDELFESLAGAPSLRGALCKCQSELFDGTDGPNGDRTRRAARLCRQCPALDRCRTWAEDQPDRALSGVIAGRLYTYVSHDSLRRWPNGIRVTT